MKIVYEYQWRNALAKAINDHDEERVQELGEIAEGWIGSAEDQKSYEKLIEAVLELLGKC